MVLVDASEGVVLTTTMTCILRNYQCRKMDCNWMASGLRRYHWDRKYHFSGTTAPCLLDYDQLRLESDVVV